MPKDGSLTITEVISFYNDYCHPQAVFETVEGVTGFLEDNIPDTRMLKDFIANLPEELCVRLGGDEDVSVKFARPDLGNRTRNAPALITADAKCMFTFPGMGFWR